MKLCRFGAAIGFAIILFVSMIHSQEAAAHSYAGSHATVLVDSLNIRSDGSFEGDVIGSLQKGSTVQAYDEAHGWIQIRTGELEGWVAGYYLNVGDESPVAVVQADSHTPEVQSMQSGQVNVEALRLREGPSLEDGITALLPKGEKLSIQEQQGEWLKVSTAQAMQGWVHGSYVSSGVQSGAALQQDISLDLPGALTNSTSGIAGKVIVIDPGHGGIDGGATGVKHHTIESEINLATSFYLEQQLIDLGAKVILTRIDNENKVGLEERVAISHRYEADAFVSVHYNSAIVSASGTIAFYHSQTKDLALARAIDRHLNRSESLRHNGIAYGEYHVLRHNHAPSVLVELGFLSNASDEEIIRTSQYHQQSAKLIADALEDFFSS